MPLAHIILGATGSGRREVLLDLIRGNSDSPAAPTTFYVSSQEPSESADHCLRTIPGVDLIMWRHVDGRIVADNPASDDSGRAFFLADGRSNPVDQIEALESFLPERNLDVGRILTIVNCRLAHDQPGTAPWYDACIHFSDVVLLNRRENVPNKWVDGFIKKYRKDCLPCHFEWVKKGRVSNPESILFPEPRRLSLIFDDLKSDPTTEIEIQIESHMPDGYNDIAEENPVDPYLARNAADMRTKSVPDILPFLG